MCVSGYVSVSVCVGVGARERGRQESRKSERAGEVDEVTERAREKGSKGDIGHS